MARNKKCKNFKQYDSRWGRVKFPYAPYYMADSGCGPTACASLIVTKNKKVTPKDTGNWLRKNGYSVAGAGTAWAGITACLKAYGFSVTQHDSMSTFFSEMKKKGRMAIIVFRGGTKGGVTWTLGGHFLSCSGMTIKNGKHRLYMLDSGPRNHTGWYTYETHMKGLIAQLWTCYIPETEKEMKPKSMKGLVAYAKKRAKAHTKYGQKSPMSWGGHYDCHWFTRNVYKDCGYPDVYNRIAKKGKPHFYQKPWADNRLGPYLVAHRKAGLKTSQLKAGDIVIRPLAKVKGYHSAIYIGDGKVAETTTNKGSHIGKLTKKYTHAFRIPEPKEAVKHEAQYEALANRAIRKSASSTADKVFTLKKGKKFRTTKKKGSYVYGYARVYGWVNIKKCKKVK